MPINQTTLAINVQLRNLNVSQQSVQAQYAAGNQATQPYLSSNANGDITISNLPGTAEFQFDLDDTLIPGATSQFQSPASAACWIAQYDSNNPQCPTGPYSGPEFVDAALGNGNQQLTFTDNNDDGLTYQYMLRVTLDAGALGTFTCNLDPLIRDK